MAFCQFHWFSQVLQKQIGTWVLLPDGGTPPFATYYLLHGLSDDHTIWLRRTRIESCATGRPLIIVMPDGLRGFYTDNEQGPAFAKYIGEELPDVIERTFHAKTTRDGRCIGGLSMGGYGALRIALGYPDKFISANSHSGALLGPSASRAIPVSPEFGQIIGSSYPDSSHDLAKLARQAKQRGLLPAIRVDCGTEDFLLNDNRGFHAQLQELQVPHEYEEFPGGHTWDYWDVHVREALDFHGRHQPKT